MSIGSTASPPVPDFEADGFDSAGAEAGASDVDVDPACVVDFSAMLKREAIWKRLMWTTRKRRKKGVSVPERVPDRMLDLFYLFKFPRVGMYMITNLRED